MRVGLKNGDIHSCPVGIRNSQAKSGHSRLNWDGTRNSARVLGGPGHVPPQTFEVLSLQTIGSALKL